MTSFQTHTLIVIKAWMNDRYQRQTTNNKGSQKWLEDGLVGFMCMYTRTDYITINVTKEL